MRIPQAPGKPAQAQDELASLRVGQEQPATDEGGLADLGDMNELLQLEASAPAIEAPLEPSPLEEPGDESGAEDYARHLTRRPSFQTGAGKGRKKSPLVIIITVVVCFLGGLIGYVAVQSFTGGPEPSESQAGFNLDGAKKFTEDYIALLEDGDIDAAVELLSPELKRYTDKYQIERLAKLVGKSEIVELKVLSTHFEEGIRGNQYYLWYKLRYDLGIQGFVASVREVDTGFTIDGIAAEGTLGQTVVIGRQSFHYLSGMAVASKIKRYRNILAILGAVILIIGLIQIIAWWVLFEKAGRPGWASIVPFYSMWVLAEIGGKPGWMGLAMYFCGVIPVIGFIVQIVLWITISIGVSKNFGRGVGFGIGLSLLPYIFYPILAFSRG
jgi:flagellar basal body-associated protein FliL